MTQDSLWLGSYRKPVRQAMIISIAITLALYAWLVANRIIFGDDALGMHE
ncbi:MAG: TRAP transporter small permease, partial [Marivita sp. XM-24bin2]